MRRKSFVLEKLKFCMDFFQVFGFGSKLSFRQVLRYLITMFGLIALTVDGAITLWNFEHILFVDLFYRITTMTFLVGNLLASIWSIFQSFNKANTVEKFYQKIASADSMIINDIKFKIDYAKMQWKLTTTMIVTLALFTMGNMFVFSNIFWTSRFKHFAVHNVLPSLIIRISMQKCYFMTQLLQFYIKTLVDILERIVKFQPSHVRHDAINRWKWKTRNNHMQIVTIRKVYRILWESSILLSETYDSVILVKFAMNFLTVLSQSYSISIRFAKGQPIPTRYIVSIVMTLAGFYLTHFHAQQCINDVRIFVTSIFFTFL